MLGQGIQSIYFTCIGKIVMEMHIAVQWNSYMYNVEEVKCPVYSVDHLEGPGEVSCIERCPHFRSKFVL